MANKIQLRRGLKSSMPTGSAGEPLYATDTRELFVGTGSGNVNMGGSHWYRGTAMSGTSSTTGTYSYSACPQVKLDDMYLNTSNGNIYVCTTAGSGSGAKWTYQGCIKGSTGSMGATGAAASDKNIYTAIMMFAAALTKNNQFNKSEIVELLGDHVCNDKFGQHATVDIDDCLVTGEHEMFGYTYIYPQTKRYTWIRDNTGAYYNFPKGSGIDSGKAAILDLNCYTHTAEIILSA